MERREKDGSGGGGGGGGKERNLSLVDVYDIAADIGKVSGREEKGDKLWYFSPHCVTPALEGNESNDG